MWQGSGFLVRYRHWVLEQSPAMTRDRTGGKGQSQWRPLIMNKVGLTNPRRRRVEISVVLNSLPH